MGNINVVVVQGNLTKDPELRQTQSGTPVASLRIAVNDREKVDGEWQDRANYFDVTVWGRQGESCATYLSKGSGLIVSGRLRWREWQTQEGAKRQTVEIVADNVRFMGGRQEGQQQQQAGGEHYDDEWPPAETTAADSDIPF